jgi:serine/threonine protein kinase
MGVVYLADGPMGLIAVKTIHAHLADDPSFHSRFQSEVQACFRVRGPHTAELVDFDVTAATPWLATEFVDAPDLEQLIRRDGALSGDAQYALALGLADALISLHDRGIVHRDLKPSNVLCPATGPRVIDFGIAAAVDEAGLTRTGSFVGTTAWMAPERIEGMTTPAADIYAWGALLAYAATGRPLFDDATPLQLMMMVANAQPHVDYDALDPRLRDAVASALARSPEFRPTAHQLRDLLTDPSHVRPVVHNVVPCPGPAPVEFASPPVVKLDHWAGRTSQFPWVDPFAKTYSAAQIGNREKAGSRRSRVTVAVLALVSLTAFVVAILLAGHGSPRILLLRLEAHPAFTASALTGAALATAVICWLLRRKRAARR